MFYGDKALLNNVAENKKFLDADFYAKMVKFELAYSGCCIQSDGNSNFLFFLGS